jgi:poly(hydroxyalkanoate) depolymerase family esterase
MIEHMDEILSLTKSGDLGQATSLIQRSLGMATREDAPMRRAKSVWPTRSSPPRLSSPAWPGVLQPSRFEGAGEMRRHTFSFRHGKLDYLLFVPTRIEGPAPLVIMLHGCTQSAMDFAEGTQMNALAEEHGVIVAYPEQTQLANPQKCWNWFRPGDQQNGSGEPAMIAGIARTIIETHEVDPARVYVAGLSAGGAAASIMACAYPDMFAAAGIHSGLACGSANSLPSALATMQGQSRTGTRGDGRYVPLITFHGDRDSTVHPSNSRRIHDVWANAPELQELRQVEECGTSAGGRNYRKLALADTSGRTFAESWEINCAGHAWSGGSSTGSYTDSAGPDATREMVRFFFQHRLP